MSQVAVRTAVGDLMPGRPEPPLAAVLDEPQLVRIEIPGKLARYLA
ncbi:hypothetical protein [Actinophytocola sediminis]